MGALVQKAALGERAQDSDFGEIRKVVPCEDIARSPFGRWPETSIADACAAGPRRVMNQRMTVNAVL